MKVGQLIKCADDPWCGGWVKAHKSHGKWVRFVQGHHARTPEGRAVRAKTGVKNIKKYNVSAEGKVQLRNLHKLPKTEEQLKASRKNIKTWLVSAEGKAFTRKNGKKQGPILGKEWGGKSHGTKYERLMMQKLDRWGIEYVHQMPVSKGKGSGSGGCYMIDIYLSKWKAALEIDGKGHDTKKQKRHDAIRKDFLLSQGISTLRIKNKKVKKLTRKKLTRLLLRAVNTRKSA
jgi:very-short-patch-repair endonuclease